MDIRNTSSPTAVALHSDFCRRCLLRNQDRPLQPVALLRDLRALCVGLLAKPMLITLPFVCLLLDFWPLGRFDVTMNAPPAIRFARSGGRLRGARPSETSACRRGGQRQPRIPA